jgi:hypothetical protein
MPTMTPFATWLHLVVAEAWFADRDRHDHLVSEAALFHYVKANRLVPPPKCSAEEHADCVCCCRRCVYDRAHW